MIKKNIVSILLTLFVIILYLIPNFTTAMQVEMNKNNYKRTDTIKFSIKHTALTEKITNVTLFIDDSLICNNCSFTEIKNYDCIGYGYGYGYGYGCEDDSFEAELIYSFESLSYGEHSFEITLNSKYSKSGKFTIEEEQEVIEVVSSEGRSSGGGGSGIKWDCNLWSECSDGNKTRVCFDKRNNKRTERIGCKSIIIEVTIEKQKDESIIEEIEEKITDKEPFEIVKQEKKAGSLFIIIGIIIILGIILIVAYKKIKHKE